MVIRSVRAHAELPRQGQGSVMDRLASKLFRRSSGTPEDQPRRTADVAESAIDTRTFRSYGILCAAWGVGKR